MGTKWKLSSSACSRIIFRKFRKTNSNYPDKRKFFLWFLMIYELLKILKWTYDFDKDDEEVWNYIPQLKRWVYVQLWDKFRLELLKPPFFFMLEKSCLKDLLMQSHLSQLLKLQALWSLKSLSYYSSFASKANVKKKVLEILDLHDLHEAMTLMTTTKMLAS